MVALLYVSVTGDSEKPIYQVVVGASLLSTLANPWMIRASDRVGDWAERCCPERVARVLEGYRGFLARYRSHSSDSAARRAFIRSQLLTLVAMGVLGFAVAIVFSMLNARDWSNLSPFFDAHKRIFFSIAMNAVLFAIVPGVFKIARSLADSITRTMVGAGEARWQLAIQNVTRFAVMSAVLALAFLEIMMININLAPEETWARAVIAVVLLVVGVFGWRFFVRAGHRAAKNFGDALKADERLAAVAKEVTFAIPESSVANLVLPMLSSAVGATVGSLNVRAKTGAVVIEVERDGRRIRNIGPEFEFRAGDALVALGDGHQVAALKDLLGITA